MQVVARLRNKLQAMRAALGDFAYVISNDLRAQLRHITAYRGLLREELQGQLSGDTAQFRDTTANAANSWGARSTAGLMARALLDRVELQEVVVDSAALVAEARTQLSDEVANRQIDWRLLDGLPALRGDAALLRQLFVHLLFNALKFSRPRLTTVIQIGWAPASEQGLVNCLCATAAWAKTQRRRASCSTSSSACTAPASSRAWAWGWRWRARGSSIMAAASPSRARRMRGAA